MNPIYPWISLDHANKALGTAWTQDDLKISLSGSLDKAKDFLSKSTCLGLCRFLASLGPPMFVRVYVLPAASHRYAPALHVTACRHCHNDGTTIRDEQAISEAAREHLRLFKSVVVHYSVVYADGSVYKKSWSIIRDNRGFRFFSFIPISLLDDSCTCTHTHRKVIRSPLTV